MESSPTAKQGEPFWKPVQAVLHFRVQRGCEEIAQGNKVAHLTVYCLFSKFRTPGRHLLCHERGQLEAYSLKTSQVSKIASINDDDSLYGVAYDSMANKVYFCSKSKIYRANLDGTAMETVLSTTQCK